MGSEVEAALGKTRDDPEWHRSSAWLAGEHFANPAGTVAVLGIPLRLGSLTPGRSDLAPGAIREALARFSTFEVESGIDLRELRARDCGDLPVADLTPEQAFDPIRERVGAVLQDAAAMVALGGDNSITRPVLHGMSLPLAGCGLLTLDAHFDLRTTTGGLTNGNPVRALLEDGLPGPHVVHIGIQSFANSDAAVKAAREAGNRFVAVSEVRRRGIETVVADALAYLGERVDAIYVDLDVDVLDRALAPATPGSRPGGLSCHEVQTGARLCGAHAKVRVLDLVEIDPLHDIANATVMAAASFLLAFSAGLLIRVRT